MNKPCYECPFGPNRDVCYGKRTLERAVEVVEDEIKSGNLQRGQPQICHKLLARKLKLGEIRENQVSPKDESEECIGHRLYIENVMAL